MAPGGEVEAIEVGGGVDAEGSGMERGIVVVEVSIPRCITQAVTRSGEAAGMWRFSMDV